MVRYSPILILLVVFSGCGIGGIGEGNSKSAALGNIEIPSGGCHIHNGLPDPHCTPGAIVSGIAISTICKKGYSKTVRPPVNYTDSLKLQQMKLYHLSGSPKQYEEDHLIALEIGGNPRNPANLWPEPRAGKHSAFQKDQIENATRRLICSKQESLSTAQQKMARDWEEL